MVRAVDPKKVNTLADVISAYKRKAKNITLNLTTGAFEIHDAKDKVAKTIRVSKGYDAAYVINRSDKPADVQSSGEFMAKLRQASVIEATEYESEFAELQDELLQAVETWKATTPGATRANLALTIGRLERKMALAENELRDAQYTYREAQAVDLKRRVYNPASNDDRNGPHPVYKLNQYSTTVLQRVVPIA